jgi:hypothetical protein
MHSIVAVTVSTEQEASSSTVSVTERQPLHALHAMCDVGPTCRTVMWLFSLLPATTLAQCTVAAYCMKLAWALL